MSSTLSYCLLASIIYVELSKIILKHQWSHNSTNTNVIQFPGSAIHMSSSPATIKPLLTPELTLTCHLNKESLLNASRGPLDCNVTMTSQQVDVINSILIMKDTGEELASVTEKKQAHLLTSDVTDVVVTGNVTGGGDVRGWVYLSDILFA